MRTLLLLLLLIACGHPEGSLDGECMDNIDNDEDGAVDCEDEDCSGSSDCNFDNVQACQDWLDAYSCGEYDFSDSVDCGLYSNYGCDVSDYFDCLTENTFCDEETGVPETSGWTNCTDYADCG